MMAWLKFIGNPKNWVAIYTTVKEALGLIQAAIAEYKRIQEEAKRRADQEAAQRAVDELRSAPRSGKTPEELEKEQEDAFDRFHDRLK